MHVVHVHLQFIAELLHMHRIPPFQDRSKVMYDHGMDRATAPAACAAVADAS